jgi:hypothetical protein
MNALKTNESLSNSLSTQKKTIQSLQSEIDSLKQHVIEEGVIDIDSKGILEDEQQKNQSVANYLISEKTKKKTKRKKMMMKSECVTNYFNG